MLTVYASYAVEIIQTLHLSDNNPFIHVHVDQLIVPENQLFSLSDVVELCLTMMEI